MRRQGFTNQVISIIHSIPPGRVSTYGMVAAMAGNSRAARQVARILHSSSAREDLPWHRVINRQGRISLPPFQGYELQKSLLEAEGVVFDSGDRVELAHVLWSPESAE
ncbi:MGMT family protein [Desulfogranum mediterraneum]|uniref:MGMT family protein n=1 Tax=Desulfogranum mediterraneum TaxID=160661 RepID=UPI0003FA0A41|nr:MGMT family protein [Desulfogranum mediterraneum]